MIDFFGAFKIDAAYVVIGLLVLTLVSLIVAIVSIIKTSKTVKKYNEMMQGSDGKSIERLVKQYTTDIKGLKEVSENNTVAIKDLYEKMENTFQKIGIVKYDAFHEMGGKLSFALCMLDKKNNGYVINVMHSNNGCFAYIKEIVKGQSFIDLGDEEVKAVNQALAGKMGDAELSKEINDLVSKDKM